MAPPEVSSIANRFIAPSFWDEFQHVDLQAPCCGMESVQQRPVFSGSSGSPIAVLRKHAAKWLFPQEKATFD
jgi:hypothetical protein